jgi:hypothetical protein
VYINILLHHLMAFRRAELHLALTRKPLPFAGVS